MKFLIDQPVSPLLAEWLLGNGHDAFHLRERGLSRLPDEEIFRLAKAEGRIIVTADLDFSRIIALSGRDAPGLILFRAGPVTDRQMLGMLERVIHGISEERLVRSVVVVDRTSFRIAPLPLPPATSQGRSFR